MPSFPPVQSVQRALRLLAELNRQRVTSVAELHRRTGLPKPTIVRLLETLQAEGFIANDRRLGGYQVTSQVASLSNGFHGAPLIVEAARPWALELTRRVKWPVAVGVLEADAIVVRYSTIPDSPISPFHATINMRLSLVARSRYNKILKDNSLSSGVACPADKTAACSDANDQQALASHWGTPMFIGGAALVGVATYLYLSAPQAERVARTAFVPSVTPDGIGLAAIGRF